MSDTSTSPLRTILKYAMLVAALSFAPLYQSGMLGAQSPGISTSASARLKQVLPPDVATRVLARIEAAQKQGLPGNVLEQRALKFAAKGVDPAAIEKSIAEHADRMAQANVALKGARSRRPSGDEIDAGADAIRKGVDGGKVSELARSAPSGRSLAVPLYVIGSLIDRGLPADVALQRVQDRLNARASDATIEDMLSSLPAQAASGQSHRPANNGRDVSAGKRPSKTGAAAGRPPAGVPANPGQGRGKGKGGKPSTPPGRTP